MLALGVPCVRGDRDPERVVGREQGGEAGDLVGAVRQPQLSDSLAGPGHHGEEVCGRRVVVAGTPGGRAVHSQPGGPAGSAPVSSARPPVQTGEITRRIVAVLGAVGVHRARAGTEPGRRVLRGRGCPVADRRIRACPASTATSARRLPRRWRGSGSVANRSANHATPLCARVGDLFRHTVEDWRHIETQVVAGDLAVTFTTGVSLRSRRPRSRRPHWPGLQTHVITGTLNQPCRKGVAAVRKEVVPVIRMPTPRIGAGEPAEGNASARAGPEHRRTATIRTFPLSPRLISGCGGRLPQPGHRDPGSPRILVHRTAQSPDVTVRRRGDRPREQAGPCRPRHSPTPTGSV